MTVTHVIGVDPGLVHTGVVQLLFHAPQKRLEVQHAAVPGLHRLEHVPEDVADWAARVAEPAPRVFIEAYRPRSNFGTDPKMRDLLAGLRRALPDARVLDNTGVKQVIVRPLMELLQLWRFPTRTHHQDVRSAARIALYGMAREPQLNRVLADFVRDAVDAAPWQIDHK